MRLGHAIFGERNRGHALLCASTAADLIAPAIVGRMDLPGTQPPGTSWKPYVSGFSHDDHFVISRTMNDEQAQRAGMVFSRALILPLASAEALSDIGGLFDLLARLGQRREPVDDIEWAPSEATAQASAAMAEALLADGEGPVIWPRQDGFEEAIAGLWRNLWPSARAAFSFSLAFRPQDLAANPPLVIAVPSALAGRWGNYRRTGSASSAEGAAAALLVGETAGEPLRALMTELGTRAGAIADLRQLSDLQMALAEEGNFEIDVTAIRNVAYLSPSPDLGRTLKKKLLGRAIDAMAAADASAILMARNLDLSPFASSSAFWKKMAGWAATSLWTAAAPLVTARVIRIAFADSGALVEWRSAVKSGIDVAVAASSATMLACVWQIALAAPDILEILVSRASDLDAFEVALIAQTPRQIPIDAGAVLMAVASTLGRPRLHAAIAASSIRPLQAVDAHMAEGHWDSASLEIALRHASPKEKIDVALDRDVADLFAIAGAAAAQNPKLLASLAIANKRWRTIWREALARNPGAWEGPRSPRSAADALWSDLVGGDSEVLQLLRPLAATPLADISAHPARPRIWSLVPSDLRQTILTTTAKGAAAAFMAGRFDEGIEEILGIELAKAEHSDPMLSALVQDPARGIALFRLLPQLDEGIFRAWCDEMLRHTPTLPAPVAENLGRLLAARMWRDTASHLATLATSYLSSRTDLRPALRNCLDLVGFLDRWFLGMTSAPPSETRWDILQEVAIELYHTGPGHDELWSRAGGKNAKLPLQGNGAAKWRHVITQARNGKLDVKMAHLVKQMHIDYPGNRALSKLHSERLF